MNELIPDKIILAAKSGDSMAILEIMRHYSVYINSLSKRVVHDEYGNQYLYVDNEIRHKVETALLSQIVNVFDPSIYPTGSDISEK